MSLNQDNTTSSGSLDDFNTAQGGSNTHATAASSAGIGGSTSLQRSGSTTSNRTDFTSVMQSSSQQQQQPAAVGFLVNLVQGPPTAVRDIARNDKKAQELQAYKLQLKYADDVEFYEITRQFLKDRAAAENDFAAALSNVAKEHAERLRKYEERVKAKMKTQSFLGTAFFKTQNAFGVVAPDENGDQESSAASALPAKGRRVSTGTTDAPPLIPPKSAIPAALISETEDKLPMDERAAGMTSSIKAFASMVAETASLGRARFGVYEKYKAAADDMKHYNIRKVATLKRYKDYFAKLQESLMKSYEEVEKAKRAYDEAEKKVENSRAKLFKIKEGKLDEKAKAEAKLRAHQRVSDDAKSDYILSLEAMRVHQLRYYEEDLPGFVRRIDADCFGLLQHHMQNALASEETSQTRMSSVIRDAGTIVAKIDRDQEYTAFLKLADNESIFATVSPVPYEPYGTTMMLAVDTEQIPSNPEILVDLKIKLEILLDKLADADLEMQKRQKELDGVDQLLNSYMSNPSFGNSSGPADQKVQLETDLVQRKNERAKIAVQVKRLQNARVEIQTLTAARQKALANVSENVTFTLTAPKTASPQALVSASPTVSTMSGLGPSSVTATPVSMLSGATATPAAASGATASSTRSKYAPRSKTPAGGASDPGASHPSSVRSSFVASSLPSQRTTPPANTTPPVAAAPATIATTAAAGPTKLGTVLYDYTAQSLSELTVKERDQVKLLEDEVQGWVKVELRGKVGIIPFAYVQAGGPTAALALYDLDARETDEISFKAGDVIDIVSTGTGGDDEEWWIGKVRGTTKVGQFPKVFVEVMADEQAATAASASATASVSASVASATTTTTTTTSATTSAAAGSSASQQQNSAASGSMSSGAAGKRRSTIGTNTPSPAAPQTSSPDRMIVRAKYPYQAAVDGELTLVPGAIIQVTNPHLSEDWWEGRLLASSQAEYTGGNSSGKVGQFPKAYVETEWDGKPRN